MNILDENVREDQYELLRHWGIPVRQIGVDAGRKGMLDEEIIPLLHSLRDTTFFSRDMGFADRKLCHPQYCLVCLAVGTDEVAVFARLFCDIPNLTRSLNVWDRSFAFRTLVLPFGGATCQKKLIYGGSGF